jgi:hypothetical protein
MENARPRKSRSKQQQKPKRLVDKQKGSKNENESSKFTNWKGNLANTSLSGVIMHK